MKDHALIGKFLGLWPSERDLARWIKTWWNPKGEYDFQLTIIFYNLKTRTGSFKMAHIFSILDGYIFGSGQIASAQKKKISLLHQSRSASTPFRRSFGLKKS